MIDEIRKKIYTSGNDWEPVMVDFSILDITWFSYIQGKRFYFNKDGKLVLAASFNGLVFGIGCDIEEVIRKVLYNKSFQLFLTINGFLFCTGESLDNVNEDYKYMWFIF